MTDKKQCRACGTVKPVSAFYIVTKRKASGVYRWPAGQCKECVKAKVYQRQSSPEGRVAARAYARNRSPEARKEARKLYAKKHGRVYLTAHEREESRQAQAAVTAARHEAEKLVKQHAQAAARASKPWLEPGLTDAEKWRCRYEHDPVFNLREKVRAGLRRKRRSVRISKIVRAAVTGREGVSRAERFLGYTIQELKAHLQEQFRPGMDWERFCRGEIHIDHIRPVSSFDLSDPEQLHLAWRLQNLQPLWAEENIRKGSRWA